MKSRISTRSFITMIVSATAVACGSETPPDPGTGGTSGVGGVGAAGASAAGGTAGTTGGSAGTGGSAASGGTGGSAGSSGAGAGGVNPTGGAGAGGVSGTGGTAGTGGASGSAGSGGASGAAGSAGAGAGGMGGTAGAAGGGSGGGGNGGSGGGTVAGDGPCDIFEEGGTPCVAAYSTVRRLLSTYNGPLYQVRSGSNAMNTGSGGETHDIGMTAAGYADAEAQDAICANTTCTVSLLYDQSGRGSDLPVAKAGLSAGGEWADDDDFESIADEEEQIVGGNRVYPLYMEARQGYRLARVGDGMPRGTAAQGIYMLADGTHSGGACCWDFGNVSTNPKTYHVMNTLFFGVAYWGKGEGNGPWFMADYEAGVWAGGSNPGDPGWGDLNSTAQQRPANPANPSLRVPYAIGFLKTDPQDWSLRMADLEAQTTLTTAYQGELPKAMDNQGGIVLGVGGDNSNNSWGTFFEGAIVSGFPSDEVEQAVMTNVKAAGYGQ